MNTDESVYKLMAMADNIDPSLAQHLHESISRIASSLSSHSVTESERKKALVQLNAYLRKKADEFDPMVIDERMADLRKIRNELTHGKLRHDLDFNALYPLLWKAISRLGDILGPEELENLLAYTLYLDNMGIAKKGGSSSRVITTYRNLFNSFESERKRRVFAELLLRLFSDKRSLALLHKR